MNHLEYFNRLRLFKQIFHNGHAVLIDSDGVNRAPDRRYLREIEEGIRVQFHSERRWVREQFEPKAIRAASELERLIPHLKDIVVDIRNGYGRPYALVYEARRELSRIVAKLGAGTPARSGHDWSDL